MNASAKAQSNKTLLSKLLPLLGVFALALLSQTARAEDAASGATRKSYLQAQMKALKVPMDALNAKMKAISENEYYPKLDEELAAKTRPEFERLKREVDAIRERYFFYSKQYGAYARDYIDCKNELAKIEEDERQAGRMR